ncbi:MAG: gliding motility lipoprotein GldB [Flavobacteriaceae bacterium]|nr:gliding motility lipoprotein GldB [Flavobacteriaceae bacterium]
MIANHMLRLNTFFSNPHQYLLFIIIFIFFSSCKNENNNESVTNQTQVSISFERFDLKFYNQSPEVIPQLKKEYPFLFPKQFSDSVWINRQSDSLQLLLQDAVIREYPDLSNMEQKVSDLFRHIKYYFPKTKIPRVITLTNNVDYQIKTIYSDSLLLISLDTFLGEDHPFYDGIPAYIRKELDRKYLLSQIVEKFASYIIPPNEDRTFLAEMLFEGKKLYLQDLLLPDQSDEIKIAYTKEELEWVSKNEIYIWQYFIEKQVLYQTDPDWVERFLEPAPFSKFYLDLDNETPGKIGRWIGWQIVRSYCKKHPHTSLIDLIKIPAQKLFNLSKYKPKR